GQKPTTAQYTVTGAGCCLVAKQGKGPRITSATIGKVVDMGITDPFNMGADMAPAAVDTIIANLKERNIDLYYYDYIVTCDLCHIGREMSIDLLRQRRIDIQDNQYVDCGLTIYREDQSVLTGGSGTACSAVGLYGHYLKLF